MNQSAPYAHIIEREHSVLIRLTDDLPERFYGGILLENASVLIVDGALSISGEKVIFEDFFFESFSGLYSRQEIEILHPEHFGATKINGTTFSPEQMFEHQPESINWLGRKKSAKTIFSRQVFDLLQATYGPLGSVKIPTLQRTPRRLSFSHYALDNQCVSSNEITSGAPKSHSPKL